MANTYSSSLRLIIQQDGTNQGTWGGYTNTNIASLIEQAITGVGAITVSGSSNYTLTVTNGASDEARNAILNITGTLTAAINVICPTAAKTYIVKNGTTGGFAITLKTSAGTGISVPNGSTMQLYCNGTDVVNSISYVNGTATNATNAANLTGGAAGSIPYQTSAGATSQLAAGTNGYVLTLSGGLPTWASPTATGVTTFSAGTTGLTPSTATSGAVTLAGTLSVANGGTGVTTATGTGSVVKADSPAFTGTPTAPTAGTGTNTTQVATTAFVTTNNQTAKAWVNFDGTLTGTITPRANYNISSVTKNGTGDYTLNFTSALSDANYSVVGSGSMTGALILGVNDTAAAPTTTAVRISTYATAGVVGNAKYANVAIFGN